MSRKLGTYHAQGAFFVLFPGPDLDRSAAKIFIDAVGDGEHRAACGGTAQSLQHAGLRFGIQIGGDLIQQQHGGICSGGTGFDMYPVFWTLD